MPFPFGPFTAGPYLGFRKTPGFASRGAGPEFTSPASLEASGYWKSSDYAGTSPWVGAASAGLSSGRNIAGVDLPAQGTGTRALNGVTTADFDGINDVFVTDNILGDFGWTTEFGFVALINIDVLAADGASGPKLFSASGFADTCGVGIGTSGAYFQVTDTEGSKQTPYVPITAGTWVMLKGKWANQKLYLAKNNDPFQDGTPSGPPGLLSSLFRVFANRDLSAFLDGRLSELEFFTFAPDDTDFFHLGTSYEATYALSLGFGPLPERVATIEASSPAQVEASTVGVRVASSMASSSPSQTSSAAAGARVSATSATSSPAQSESAVGVSRVSSTVAASSPAQTEVAAGSTTVIATAATSSPMQTESAAATANVTATAATSSSAQTESAAATANVTATVATNTPAQTDSAAANAGVTASLATSSPAQTESAAATANVTAAVATSTPAQTEAASVGAAPTVSASVEETAPAQTEGIGAVGGPAVTTLATLAEIQPAQTGDVTATVSAAALPHRRGAGGGTLVAPREEPTPTPEPAERNAQAHGVAPGQHDAITVRTIGLEAARATVEVLAATPSSVFVPVPAQVEPESVSVWVLPSPAVGSSRLPPLGPPVSRANSSISLKCDAPAMTGAAVVAIFRENLRTSRRVQPRSDWRLEDRGLERTAGRER